MVVKQPKPEMLEPNLVAVLCGCIATTSGSGLSTSNGGVYVWISDRAYPRAGRSRSPAILARMRE